MGTDSRQDPTRLEFIDNLRTFLISLVVLHHLSITYGAPGGWYYKEIQPDQMPLVGFGLFSLFVSCNQAFFMGLFFFVSALFVPRACDRKGKRRFLTDRLLRLGVPLAVYVLIIDPLIRFLLAVSLHGFEGGLLEFLEIQLSNFRGFGFGPLWFVEALLFFSFAYLAARWFRPPKSESAAPETKAPGNLVLAGFGLGLGLVSFTVRIWLPIGWSFAPLNLQFPFFPQYIVLFVAGLVAARKGWLSALPDSAGRLWGWIAAGSILFWIGMFSLGGALDGKIEAFMGGGSWQSFAYAMWEQLFCVAICVRLITWFRRRFDRQGPFSRALSNSAYGVFVIHSPILVCIGLALRDVGLPAMLKFFLLAPVVLVICFSLAWALRRLPGVRRVL